MATERGGHRHGGVIASGEPQRMYPLPLSAASVRSSRREGRSRGMFKLFYSPGSCALASHTALEEAAAEYTVARVDFSRSEQRSPEDCSTNPMNLSRGREQRWRLRVGSRRNSQRQGKGQNLNPRA